MSRPLLFSSLALSVMLIGCGGGGGSGKSSATQSLDFASSGTYDLSRYIVPTQNQLNTFVDRTYIDNTGNSLYGPTPVEITESIQRYEVTNATVKEYDENGQLDTTYTISQTAITQISTSTESFQMDETAQSVRYADLGDPVATATLFIPLEGFNEGMTLTMNCRLQEHFDSKTINTVTYDDVIAIACDGVNNLEYTYQSVPITLDMNTAVTFYYAHNLGEISSVSESCYTISATQTAHECIKKVSEIASIL